MCAQYIPLAEEVGQWNWFAYSKWYIAIDREESWSMGHCWRGEILQHGPACFALGRDVRWQVCSIGWQQDRTVQNCRIQYTEKQFLCQLSGLITDGITVTIPHLLTVASYSRWFHGISSLVTEIVFFWRACIFTNNVFHVYPSKPMLLCHPHSNERHALDIS